MSDGIYKDLGFKRSDYIKYLRRRQPIIELKRKAEKAARLKGKLWTEEDIDLGVAEALRLADYFVEES